MNSEAPTPAKVARPAWDLVLGAAGGLIGAVTGYFLFFAIARQGFYAIILPGALAGIGCGGFSGRKSLPLGVACAVLGIFAGILAEWRFAPFVADRSFLFFMSHLGELPRFTQVLILVGAFFAFWFGRGREGGAWLRKQSQTGKEP